MRMCDEDGLYSVQHFRNRHRQRHQRIFSRIWRVLDRRSRARLIQHRIDDQFVAVILNREGGVPDEA